MARTAWFAALLLAAARGVAGDACSVAQSALARPRRMRLSHSIRLLTRAGHARYTGDGHSRRWRLRRQRQHGQQLRVCVHGGHLSGCVRLLVCPRRVL